MISGNSVLRLAFALFIVLITQDTSNAKKAKTFPYSYLESWQNTYTYNDDNQIVAATGTVHSSSITTRMRNAGTESAGAMTSTCRSTARTRTGA